MPFEYLIFTLLQARKSLGECGCHHSQLERSILSAYFVDIKEKMSMEQLCDYLSLLDQYNYTIS